LFHKTAEVGTTERGAAGIAPARHIHGLQ
jgi:hypothetical protein